MVMTMQFFVIRNCLSRVLLFRYIIYEKFTIIMYAIYKGMNYYRSRYNSIAEVNYPDSDAVLFLTHK